MSTTALRSDIRDTSFLSATIVELDKSFIEIRIVRLDLPGIYTDSGRYRLEY